MGGGGSNIRKFDKVVNIGEDITVCLPGTKMEDVAEKAGQVLCIWGQTVPKRRECQPSFVSIGHT